MISQAKNNSEDSHNFFPQMISRILFEYSYVIGQIDIGRCFDHVMNMVVVDLHEQDFNTVLLRNIRR